MKYDTTNPDALAYEMAEKTNKQLRSIRYNNAPGTAFRAMYGEASKARHIAAYREQQNRKA